MRKKIVFGRINTSPPPHPPKKPIYLLDATFSILPSGEPPSNSTWCKLVFLFFCFVIFCKILTSWLDHNEILKITLKKLLEKLLIFLEILTNSEGIGKFCEHFLEMIRFLEIFRNKIMTILTPSISEGGE